MNLENLIPSDEQSKIVSTLLSGSNVYVSAVAGSGKTTTICWIARACPEANILLLTYNRKLKYETKQRLKAWKIKSVQTHTYHSFCFNFYDVFGGTDQIILDVLDKGLEDSDKSPIFEYDLIIIDEVQDITPLYYSLVTHIVKSNKFVPKICVLGDPHQTIYGFNGADSRFLTLAPRLFSFGPNSNSVLGLNVGCPHHID
jgi:superfamily I DNA/RNA helicase